MFGSARASEEPLAKTIVKDRKTYGERSLAMDVEALLPAFQELAKKSRFLVRGHNDNGNFRLPDGGSIKLVRVAETCAAAGIVCLFVTCNASMYAPSAHLEVRRYISLTEGVRISEAIGRRIDQHQGCNRISARCRARPVGGPSKNDCRCELRYPQDERKHVDDRRSKRRRAGADDLRREAPQGH